MSSWNFPPHEDYGGQHRTGQGNENQPPFPQPSNSAFLQRSPRRLHGLHYPRTVNTPVNPLDPFSIPKPGLLPSFPGPLHTLAFDSSHNPPASSAIHTGWQTEYAVEEPRRNPTGTSSYTENTYLFGSHSQAADRNHAASSSSRREGDATVHENTRVVSPRKSQDGLNAHANTVATPRPNQVEGGAARNRTGPDVFTLSGYVAGRMNMFAVRDARAPSRLAGGVHEAVSRPAGDIPVPSRLMGDRFAAPRSAVVNQQDQDRELTRNSLPTGGSTAAHLYPVPPQEKPTSYTDTIHDPGAPDELEHMDMKSKPSPVSAEGTAKKTDEAQSSQQAKAQRKERTKPRGGGQARGKGARSGHTNRRTGGTSDDEINKLSDAVKEETADVTGKGVRGLTTQEKLLVVQYITEERCWAQFKIKQGEHFRELAQTVLHGRVTPTQVQNYWNNQAYDKYKACREAIVEHTGGGDGDDDDSDVDDEDFDEYGEPTRKRKREIVLDPKARSNYSHAVLQEFLDSGLYDLIDRVAHKDNSVIRDREFNSAADISGDESLPPKKRTKHTAADNDLNNGLLSKVAATMDFRARSNDSIAREQLALAKARDEREHQDREDQQAARHTKLQLEERELRFKERSQALEMLKHPDPDIQEEGRHLLKKC